MTGDPGRTRFETLAVECLDQMLVEGTGALDRICAANPEHAEDLRRMLARLAGYGLLSTGGDPDGAAEPASEACPARTRPPEIGGIVIEREIGRGGMGVVYLAEQLQPINRR